MKSITLKHKNIFSKKLLCLSESIDVSEYLFSIKHGVLTVMRGNKSLIKTDGSWDTEINNIEYKVKITLSENIIYSVKNDLNIEWKKHNSKNIPLLEEWYDVKFDGADFLIINHTALGFRFTSNVEVKFGNSDVVEESLVDNAIVVLSYFWMSSEFTRNYYT